uniref:Xanthine dehydrogenase family protein subunit M n=1 Tax=Acidobacterium capsulatum TaxID=33075 RepID=A0A7V4XRR5_9BACT
MQAFRYTKSTTVDAAVQAHGTYVAGGTTLIDLMKLNVETPASLVDINPLPLAKVEAQPGGGLRIGAMVRNSDLANDEQVKKHYAVLSEALLSGASPQLRNMATTGGNLLQRTRCYYFRDTSYPCNKREPGSGCSATDGYNRIHAVLGGSEHCVAVMPSDMAVAMMALEATIHTSGSQGERKIPIREFYVLPGDTPQRENTLLPGELITHVTLAPLPANTRSYYLKLRDRAQYEFALASVAAVTTMKGRRIERVRVAMGGVGTQPWYAPEVEKALEGKEATPENFHRAAEAALAHARPLKDNGFKIELAKRAIVRALHVTTETA